MKRAGRAGGTVVGVTSASPYFPPYPIRGVRVVHQRLSCGAPHFAQIVVDFEPAPEGFAFEVAEGLTVECEPAADLPRFFAAVAAGIKEQLGLPEHGVVVAAKVVLRQAHAKAIGSHELAFKIAGYLAARKALEPFSRAAAL
jgi:translation elongation factor EF-G